MSLILPLERLDEIRHRAQTANDGDLTSAAAHAIDDRAALLDHEKALRSVLQRVLDHEAALRDLLRRALDKRRTSNGVIHCGNTRCGTTGGVLVGDCTCGFRCKCAPGESWVRDATAAGLHEEDVK